VRIADAANAALIAQVKVCLMLLLPLQTTDLGREKRVLIFLHLHIPSVHHLYVSGLLFCL